MVGLGGLEPPTSPLSVVSSYPYNNYRIRVLGTNCSRNCSRYLTKNTCFKEKF